jgi:hypothetical protein
VVFFSRKETGPENNGKVRPVQNLLGKDNEETSDLNRS